VPLPDGGELPITASFGLCLAAARVPLKQTIEFADAALYQAKDEGRNRLRLWQPGEPA
jgi:PleD family two-component response regulator